MGDGGQHVDAELASDMVGVLGKAALDCEEGLASKQDCIAEEPPILLADVAKHLLAETSRVCAAFYCEAVFQKAYLRMVGDIPKPLSVTRIPFRTCLRQATV